jgi:hypothetical protein
VAGLGPVEVGGTVPPPVAQAPTPAPAPAPPGVAILPPTLLAYPNPAHGTATVTLPAGPVGSPVGLLVFDMLGQVVGRASATLAATTTRTTLDLSGLAPGVYALRITVGPDRTTTRLVVE